MMYVCLLRILMCGTLTMVPQNTLQRNTTFSPALAGNIVTCVDNSLYPIKGVGIIVLTIAMVVLSPRDALYVPRIKKNLLSVSVLTRCGLVVIFVDDKYIVHDLNSGDTIVVFGSLSHGIYKLNAYVNRCSMCGFRCKSYFRWFVCFGIHFSFSWVVALLNGSDVGGCGCGCGHSFSPLVVGSLDFVSLGTVVFGIEVHSLVVAIGIVELLHQPISLVSRCELLC